MDNNSNNAHKSSLGIAASIAVILMYIVLIILLKFSYIKYFAWVIPVLLFVIEKESKFVKFNAVQAFFICVIRAVLSLLLFLLGNAIASKDTSGMSADVVNRWISMAMLPDEIDTFIWIGLIAFTVFVIIKALDYSSIRLPKIRYIASKLSNSDDGE